MLQLIRAILKDPEDPTQCCLLFANQVGLLFAMLDIKVAWAGLGAAVPVGRNGLVPVLAAAQGPPTRQRTLYSSKEDRAWSPILSLALSVKTLCLGFLCSVCHLCD